MATPPPDSPPPVPPPPAAPPRRRAWDGRWQRWLAGALALALLVVVATLAWLDSAPGHRFLVSRIAAVSPPSGLRIHVDRIEGSIYRKAVLRGLVLSDPKGRFFDAQRVELDWWPFAWLSNRLDIDRLVIPQATLHKLPKLNPSERQGPILPGFDIRLMQFSVDRLTVAPAVTGKVELATLSGDADIRGGRAIIDLSARVIGAEDALNLTLDSRPDDDRFNLAVTVNAPRGGVLAAMAGLNQDGNLRISGKGRWTRWDGRLAATLAGNPVADLKLGARSGAYTIQGTIEGSAIPGKGLLPRLASPRLTIGAQGTLADRVVDGRLTLRSAAIDLIADGAIDLRNNAFDNLRLDMNLARPEALLKDMRGRDVVASITRWGRRDNFGRSVAAVTDEMTSPDDKTIADFRRDNGPANCSPSRGSMRSPSSTDGRAMVSCGQSWALSACSISPLTRL